VRSLLTQDNRPSRLYRDAATIGIVAVMLSVLLCGYAPSLAGLLEIFAAALVLSTVLHFGSRFLWAAEGLLAKVAKTRFAILLVAAAGLAVASSLSLLGRFPQPYVHDEFSYLLAADTFAHGRLANPMHPMWAHLETFHVLQIPSYASRYPPAQGMILALGQLLGRPVIGVWISTALLCASVFWMLKQWTAPRWALLGAIIVCLHPEVLHWSHGFWGGQLAMAGGALTLGVFRRALYTAKARDGLIAGIGISVMANTRPYEGLVLTVVLALALFVWTRRAEIRSAFTGSWPRFLAPACAVLLLTGVAMGFYNHRVTGHWLTLPWMAYEATYNTVPPFLWQKLLPAHSYNHLEQYVLHTYLERPAYDAGQTLHGFLALSWGRTKLYANLYFLILAVPLLALVAIPLALKPDKHMRLLAVILALFYIGPLVETWASGSHYVAPAASLCFLLPLMAMRYWRVWRWKGLRLGLLLMRALIIVVLFSCVNGWRMDIEGLRGPAASWYYQRADLLKSLEQQGARSLVIVRYLPGHSANEEWVFNRALIDESTVVWARDMGAGKNRELIDYFPDRRVWLLSVGPGSGSFAPYSEALDAQP
jgi:hypothetical protein